MTDSNNPYVVKHFTIELDEETSINTIIETLQKIKDNNSESNLYIPFPLQMSFCDKPISELRCLRTSLLNPRATAVREGE